jgi:hypothetical protein
MEISPNCLHRVWRVVAKRTSASRHRIIQSQKRKRRKVLRGGNRSRSSDRTIVRGESIRYLAVLIPGETREFIENQDRVPVELSMVGLT